MFGIVFVPALRTVITRFELCASRCRFGKRAFRPGPETPPAGSFASWRSPPPHPVTTITPARAITPGAYLLLASKAGRTYHPQRGMVGAFVAPGGGQGDAI